MRVRNGILLMLTAASLALFGCTGETVVYEDGDQDTASGADGDSEAADADSKSDTEPAKDGDVETQESADTETPTDGDETAATEDGDSESLADADTDQSAPTDGDSDTTTPTDGDVTDGDSDTTTPTDGDVDDGTTESDSETQTLDPFSFFVTSLKAVRQLSGSQNGFGGDLRYGETGAGAGLRGADKICTAIAEMSMPGSGVKVWRAFLSATDDGNGNQVNAIDRVGAGPWYDRLGRVVALSKSDLANTRPGNCDSDICNDLPNEDGVPNHRPDTTQAAVDNHDTLTGSDDYGRLYSSSATCADWTSSTGNSGKPRVGHSWPRSGMGGKPGPGGGGMDGWISSLDEAGCKPGVNLVENGAGDQSLQSVGAGGGYGGFYCFALEP